MTVAKNEGLVETLPAGLGRNGLSVTTPCDSLV